MMGQHLKGYIILTNYDIHLMIALQIQHLSGQPDDTDKNQQVNNDLEASKLPNIIEEDERLPVTASDTASQRSRHNSTYLY